MQRGLSLLSKSIRAILSPILVIAAGASGVSCGSTSVVQTALHGNLTTLKRAIRAEQEAGDLDRDDVVELAGAVAAREVRSAKGQPAVDRIQTVRVCSGPLLPVLRDRARHLDDAGAEASLLLFERKELHAENLISGYSESSSGAWRAVAARATAGRKHGALRRKFIQDPDERARRAALRAAFEAADANDLSELFEAARLDPDPLAQSLATRAVGMIGGERAVLGLDDLWPRADEALRIAIVDAWGMAASYRAGGQRKLLTVAESMKGMVSVSAAALLTRKGGAPAELGASVLARAVREGTELERRIAIQLGPLSDTDVRKAIHKAASDREREIRVMALARLATNAGSRVAALEQLRQLAKRKDSVAVQARTALAAAGDASVKHQLVEQLSVRNPADRHSAALGLLSLGDYSRAASALADDDPDVRTGVACSVLSLAQTR